LDDHDAKPRVDPLVSLRQVCELLESDPGFRVTRVRQAPDLTHASSRLGGLIKAIRLQRFGAVFSDTLTLLHFKLQQPGTRHIVMNLHWHLTERPEGWAVFIHFVDGQGNLCFQGDYSLDGETPDALGFVYSRRVVVVPQEVVCGVYQVRLGVWSPAESRHLPLSRVHGCHREPPGPYHNAVLLDVVTI
jgi:hypothetical protein